ncbi:MAG: hypothetical protein M3220_12135 [Chloroflexota bacterium]|nr:hypothetical protein [Chloroflexota bacterium]
MVTGRLMVAGALVGFLFVFAAGLIRAQEPDRAVEAGSQGKIESIATPVAGSIHYQGVLKENGTPVTESRNMTFRLYSDSTCSAQVGSDIIKNGVPVSRGLFDIQLPVDQSVFNGQALWLKAFVGDDGLGCQEILPVPYALSLRPGTTIDGEGGTTLTVAASGVGSRGILARGDAFGMQAEASASGGAGITGLGNTGVSALSLTETGIAVRALASAGDGTTYGIYSEVDSPEGYAGFFQNLAGAGSEGVGVQGLSGSGSESDIHPDPDSLFFYDAAGEFAGPNGVIGAASNDAVDGYGVVGLAQGAEGRGVYGRASATGGVNYGVYGMVDSPSGWAGGFSSLSGNGVYVSVPSGKVGLNVASGTKNAVVPAEGGSRLLYTEEATEVWFVDYGFGQLQDGMVRIPIDPLFAQTVNLEEPYHVFVQVYGDAEVYVGERTPTYFDVQLREGEPDVEFSYRLVAKRVGYEDARLERAPWADDDPNLYPGISKPEEQGYDGLQRSPTGQRGNQ